MQSLAFVNALKLFPMRRNSEILYSESLNVTSIHVCLLIIDTVFDDDDDTKRSSARWVPWKQPGKREGGGGGECKDYGYFIAILALEKAIILEYVNPRTNKPGYQGKCHRHHCQPECCYVDTIHTLMRCLETWGSSQDDSFWLDTVL